MKEYRKKEQSLGEWEGMPNVFLYLFGLSSDK